MASTMDTLMMNTYPNVTNTTSEPSHAEMFYNRHSLVIVCLLCGTSIIANSLLITLIRLMPGKCNSTHLIIINLLFGDLGESTMFLVDEIINEVLKPDSSCFTMIMDALFRLFDTVSILSLLALAINQYIGICRPLHYQSIVTRTRTIIAICFIWVVSLILPFMIVLTPLAHTNWQACPAEHSVFQSAEWIFAIVLIIEVITIVVLYMKALIKVQAYRARQSSYTHCANLEQNRKAFVTTMIVLATLVLTWLPFLMYRFFVFTVMRLVDEKSVTILHSDVYYNFICFLPLINTISDPIIYGVRMHDVQQCIKRKCRNCNGGKNGLHGNGTTCLTHDGTDHHIIYHGGQRLSSPKTRQHSNIELHDIISNPNKYGTGV
ncbi:unnamed protein product [Owenia fusiformis]|uniref:Uncharacterized protein n=1 Tax=Owenia fusiformis TaxID=6347 RepID=A0A8J1U8C0_OWEFU|nr:unnamed protein product [Owenia fusiformis]